MNQTSISFIGKTFGACFTTLITRIWTTSASVNVGFFLLINKQFSWNGWGWNNIFAGTGGDGYPIWGTSGDGCNFCPRVGLYYATYMAACCTRSRCRRFETAQEGCRQSTPLLLDPEFLTGWWLHLRGAWRGQRGPKVSHKMRKFTETLLKIQNDYDDDDDVLRSNVHLKAD